jgi:2-iminobutanoate/2-iminopropanoate deaminase
MRSKIVLGAVLAFMFAAPAAAQEAQAPRFIGSTNSNSAFSRIVIAGDFIFLSGMLGSGGGANTIEDQTRRTLESIRDALAEVGATMDDVVKCTVYLANIADRAALNPIYNSFFPNHRPARTVEIECMAYKPGVQ